MSATTAMKQGSALRVEALSQPQEAALHTRPTLRVIEGTTPQRGRLSMLLIGVLVIVVSIALPMVLQTRMAQTAFEIREYQMEINALEAQAWATTSKLRSMESAVYLEEQARSLGMVPARISGTISLTTGVVEGGIAAR